MPSFFKLFISPSLCCYTLVWKVLVPFCSFLYGLHCSHHVFISGSTSKGSVNVLLDCPLSEKFLFIDLSLGEKLIQVWCEDRLGISYLV